MQRGTRQGPCGNPACPAPAKPSGQWQWIPEGFGDAITPGATCTCKKAGCRRYFGLKEDPQPPGRKRSLPAATEAPRHDDPCVPESYILAEIDEIWGHRCACPSAAARARARVRGLTPSRVARGRLASIGTMGEEARANKLPVSKMRTEYVVHGKFLRSHNDQNGKVLAYWVPLRKMVADVGREAVETDLQIYQAQAEATFQEELKESDEDESDSDESDGASG